MSAHELSSLLSKTARLSLKSIARCWYPRDRDQTRKPAGSKTYPPSAQAVYKNHINRCPAATHQHASLPTSLHVHTHVCCCHVLLSSLPTFHHVLLSTRTLTAYCPAHTLVCCAPCTRCLYRPHLYSTNWCRIIWSAGCILSQRTTSGRVIGISAAGRGILDRVQYRNAPRLM